jgi:hypothetical protein
LRRIYTIRELEVAFIRILKMALNQILVPIHPFFLPKPAEPAKKVSSSGEIENFLLPLRAHIHGFTRKRASLPGEITTFLDDHLSTASLIWL